MCTGFFLNFFYCACGRLCCFGCSRHLGTLYFAIAGLFQADTINYYFLAETSCKAAWITGNTGNGKSDGKFALNAQMDGFKQVLVFLGLCILH